MKLNTHLPRLIGAIVLDVGAVYCYGASAVLVLGATGCAYIAHQLHTVSERIYPRSEPLPEDDFPLEETQS